MSTDATSSVCTLVSAPTVCRPHPFHDIDASAENLYRTAMMSTPTKAIRPFSPLCLLVALSVWCATSMAKPPSPHACRSVSARTCAIASDLGRGVNFGDMLSAPKEGDWGLWVEREYIEEASAVFKHVRLPVRWSNHADPGEGAELDERFAKRVDAVIDALLDRGMYVILDFHAYNQLNGARLDNGEFAVQEDVVDRRFVNIWRQLGVRYKNRSDKLLFELFNEPNGRLDAPGRWNDLSKMALAAVRESNPERTVLVGPANGNHPKGLAKFAVPNDRNVIVPVHSYDPFAFTHQGVTWVAPVFRKTGITCCDASQKKSMVEPLDIAARWSEENGYPITVGEFGSHQNAAANERENYTRLFRDEAESRGFSWSYWMFAGSFGVYDARARQWVVPVRRALLD
jgi:endoglucanase